MVHLDTKHLAQGLPGHETDGTVRISKAVRIAVLGGAGYGGQEFLRLAQGHPGLEVASVVVREPESASGDTILSGRNPAASAAPLLRGLDGLEAHLKSDEIETVVSCLPHGASSRIFRQSGLLSARGIRLVDLASDFRHGSHGFVYGLPEAFRPLVSQADRIANPGCYPTAALLALLPAASRIEPRITISALSGVSGAGKTPSPKTTFIEVSGGAAMYKAGSIHPHVDEIGRCLGHVTGESVEVGFAPQVVPMARGILLTASASLRKPCQPLSIHDLYVDGYKHEPFINVLPPNQFPATHLVSHSNRADLWVSTVHGGNTLLVAIAIDNLVKGAAGQAIQNLNLMNDWPEDLGLPVDGRPW